VVGAGGKGRVGDRNRAGGDGGERGGEVKEFNDGAKVKKQEQRRGKLGNKIIGLSSPPVRPDMQQQDAKEENSSPTGDEGRSQKEDGEGSSHSSSGEDESSDTDERGDLEVLSKDTARVKTRKVRRKGTKGKEVEKEVVYVEKKAYVDRPVERSVVEKVIEVKEVERIRQVVKEVEKIVDKTPPQKQKIQLSKWGRVKKASKVLGKS
jgi:hypothetical protein